MPPKFISHACGSLKPFIDYEKESSSSKMNKNYLPHFSNIFSWLRLTKKEDKNKMLQLAFHYLERYHQSNTYNYPNIVSAYTFLS